MLTFASALAKRIGEARRPAQWFLLIGFGSRPDAVRTREGEAGMVNPLLAYRAALRLAYAHLRESEALCRQIEAVADRIDRRRWPWGAAPV